MGLSLRDAARETGKSKSTILRAIQAGRLSAARLDDGGYSIEPAELFRVYDARNASRGGAMGQDAPEPEAPAALVIDAQVAALREIIQRLDGQVADLRTDRDHWRDQAEAANRLLTDERTRQRVPWWRRVVGG